MLKRVPISEAGELRKGDRYCAWEYDGVFWRCAENRLTRTAFQNMIPEATVEREELPESVVIEGVVVERGTSGWTKVETILLESLVHYEVEITVKPIRKAEPPEGRKGA